ncbi:MAG: hypothetical protein NZV14_01620 [Bryobacteraceae bacterium]|nr:hypothetical protein [Bryobacteraceae bacterium]MDW8376828.1 hypothetical protein [Bryobacterales bacterium]
MADRLTLSFWLRGYDNPAAATLRMVDYWEKLLRLFPFSKLHQGLVTVSVRAVSPAEPILCEQAYPPPFDPEPAVQLAREFQQADCAYQLECAWDLMLFDRDWKLSPARLSLWCFGPEYENDTGDHVRIEFGPEDPFLPARNEPVSVRVAQTNLRSLMKLVQDIEAQVPVEKRLLWSESGENFAEKIARWMSAEKVKFH